MNAAAGPGAPRRRLTKAERLADEQKARQQNRLARIAARQRAGLTPAEAAKAAHISLSYYRRIEREGADSFYRAELMAHYLKCPLDIFI